MRGAVMHIGFYNFYTAYNGNRMFLSSESTIGDNLAAPSVDMAHHFAERGHRVSTIDTAPMSDYDAIVFLDYPTRLNAYFRRALQFSEIPLYLVLQENEAIRPDNYRKQNHQAFRKVFTWLDDWVDGKRYIKLFNAVGFGAAASDDGAGRDRLCALVANNKFSNHPAELYSARRESLDWFAIHSPQDIELYGEGWNRWYPARLGFVGNSILSRIYRTIPSLPHRQPYPFWRGITRQKRNVLRRVKYCICYENAVFPGYITEKIFDCFFAGCVPVYHGAPNVSRSIPPAAFIDRTQFASHQALYDYLRGMSDREYAGYRAAIAAFLASDAAQLFSGKHMTDIFLEHVVGDVARGELPPGNPVGE